MRRSPSERARGSRSSCGDGATAATLLALRERDEETAQAALAAALAAEDRARRARDRLRAARDTAERRALAGVDRDAEDALAASLQGRAGYETRLRREEAAASAALSAAGKGVAAARAALAVASSAREAIARHRAAWEEARRRTQARAEDAVGDDLAASRARAGGQS
jgi:flagellar export protein FliJ